jgi:hypothetical protein
MQGPLPTTSDDGGPKVVKLIKYYIEKQYQVFYQGTLSEDELSITGRWSFNCEELE